MGQDLRSQVDQKELENTDRVKWMEEVFTGSSVKLRDIIVIGTHNSFAKESSLPRKNSRLKFSKEKGISETCANLWLGKTVVKGICRSWSQCQSYSITQQLMDGVRYLDFRVIRTGSNFEVCHSITYGALMPLLDEVKTFIHDNPKELVFLHFQKIFNCDKKQMDYLAQEVILRFQNDIVSPKKFSLYSKLQDIWDRKKKIIIFFGDTPTAQSFSDYLWDDSKVRNPWFNKSINDELHQAIANEMVAGKNCENSLWVIQAILTPGLTEVATSVVPLFSSSRDSLKRLAGDLRAKLPSWFKEFAAKISESDRRPNVILMDFYDRKTLFPLVMRVNKAMSRRSMVSRKRKLPVPDKDPENDIKSNEWVF